MRALLTAVGILAVAAAAGLFAAHKKGYALADLAPPEFLARGEVYGAVPSDFENGGSGATAGENLAKNPEPAEAPVDQNSVVFETQPEKPAREVSPLASGSVETTGGGENSPAEAADFSPAENPAVDPVVPAATATGGISQNPAAGSGIAAAEPPQKTSVGGGPVESGSGEISQNPAVAGTPADSATPPALTLDEKAQLVAVYRTAARDAIARGDAAAALDALERLVDLDPFDVELLKKGVFFGIVGLGDAPRAARFARKLADANPDDAEAQNSLSWALLESGDLGGAWTAATRALELEPRTPGAELNLGDIAARREQPTEAKKHWQNALDLDGPDGAIGKLAAGRIAAAQ